MQGILGNRKMSALGSRVAVENSKISFQSEFKFFTKFIKKVAFVMSEKKERIKRRREIINKRLHEKAVIAGETNKEVAAIENSSSDDEVLKSDQQIAESVSQLQRKKENHTRDVTSTRVKVNKEESLRRICHEIKRREIIEKARDGGKQENICDSAGIETNWDDITHNEDIRNVHNTMKKIKETYDDIIEKKNSLLEDFLCQLKQQDHTYLESLRNQTDTINHARELSTKQISAIKAFSDQELKSINEAFRDDRRNLINDHSAHLKSLADKKRSLIEQSVKTLELRNLDREKKIGNAYDEVNKEYNALREKLQDQVVQLEREWSISRGLHMVSADQIEYDHREIETKNFESEQRIKKNKKRIVQFKENLNKELDRSKTTEKKDRKKNDCLELDCRRLEGQYQNLLSKLHRFELSEDQKYYSALAMHKEELTLFSSLISNTRIDIKDIFSGQTPSIDENKKYWDSSTMSYVEGRKSQKENETFSWSQLENVVVKYHDLLEKRASASHNVDQVSRHNHNLESELSTNLNDDINKSLIVPPL